mgnify:CR=1 FL=1
MWISGPKSARRSRAIYLNINLLKTHSAPKSADSMRILEELKNAKKQKKYYGFTLVELLLTIIIIGILSIIMVSLYSTSIDSSKIAQAKADILSIESAIQRFHTVYFRYPQSLNELTERIPLSDPWGNPYQYLNIATTKGNGKLRKDHNLVPLNTDYDLYSMGKDGKSASPLTAKASKDDIIRANNGGFTGLASDY